MPKLSWYLNRLRMMSPREIFGMRLGRLVRDAVVPDIRCAPDNVDLKIRGYDRMLAADHAALFPGKAAEVVAEAERVLAGTISLFGRDYRFQGVIDWKADPVSGWRWPDKSVSHYEGVDDPKNVWELNRHQFLPILGQAYFLTGNERYADCAVSLILSWIEANPPYLGINWVSGIELALRQLSWAWTLRFIEGSGVLDDVDRKSIACSMYLQTRLISRNLSFHSSANNHLIGELTAMVIVGTMLGQGQWVEKGARILAEEIDRQIYPDGVGAEQSLTYQTYTMEYFVLSALALLEQGKEAHAPVIEGLRRGALFLDTMMEEDGRFPMIGDSDSGIVLRLTTTYPQEKSLLNMVAFLGDMKEMVRTDAAEDDKTFWLLGRDEFHSLATSVRRSHSRKLESRKFPFGGYYLFLGRTREKRVRIICNAAPLGMTPLSGHGHADALSIIVDVEGHPVLIDPGTYTYFRGNFWRDYFRGTYAHNTVRLGGRNQAEFKGPFMALDLARAECIEWEDGRRFVGRHYGYLRKEGLIHQRTLELSADNATLVITDAFEGEGDSVAEVCFHVDPLCKVRKGYGSLIEMDTLAGMVVLSLDEGLEVTVHHGDDGLPSGWKSPCYGSLEPAFTIVGMGRVRGGSRLTTRLFF